MFGAMIKAAVGATRLVSKATRAVSNLPGGKMIPGMGTALSVIGGASAVGSLFGGSKSGGGLPALPGVGGLPALPGGGAPPIVGDRGWLQNDPNIVAALQPFAISKTNLRMTYRSPLKGYVIRHDSKGDPYAIPKSLARAYLGWKPAKKPPISVGDWNAVRTADRVIKKMRKITTTMTKVDKGIKGGKVTVKKRK